MNKFAQMQHFVAVVDAGSLAEAARRLGLAKSVISQQMQALEQRLGASLLERGRQMRVTDAGQVFYAHCRRILLDVGQAEDAVATEQTRLRGSLRLAIPMAFGIRFLAPMLSAFAQRYPELQMDVESSDRYVNMHEEHYDLAIRMGQLPDSSLIARPLAPNHHLICASPAYLAERGRPTRPQDLHAHDGLLYINREPHGMWQLPVQGNVQSFRIRTRLRTDSGHQLLEAAKAGLGLAILPTFLAADAIMTGALEIVLPGHSPSGGQIAVVYRQSHRASSKIHAMVDFLAAQIGQPALWDQAIASQLQVINPGTTDAP